MTKVIGYAASLWVLSQVPAMAILGVDYAVEILNPSQNVADLAVDSEGNVWVTGNTPFAASFGTTPGALQETWVGPIDVFVAKINAQGQIVYATYIPADGRSTDIAGGLAIDADDNVYIVGDTTNGLRTTTPDAFQAEPPGNTDTFLVKLDSDGNLLYASHIGGNGRDSAALGNDDPAAGVAVDAQGNVYVVGATSSTDFPTQAAIQTERGGGNPDVFVMKFDSSFALQWSTYYGFDFDYGKRAATDPDGNLYVLGWADEGFPTTSGAFQEGGASSRQYFVAKFLPDGQLGYATYFNGAEASTAFPGDLGVSPTGEVAFGGYVFDDDVVTTAGSFQPDRAGDSDAFAAKLDAAGSDLVFSTYLGGSLADATAGAVGIGGDGAVYIAGRADSDDFPVTDEIDPLGDSFLARISPDGTALEFSTRLNVERVRSLAVDDQGSIYLVAEVGTPGSVVMKISDRVVSGCTGDCDDDGTVTIAELIRAVNVALGRTAPGQCAAADSNGDGSVSIAELIQAVNAALRGCTGGAESVTNPVDDPGCHRGGCSGQICSATPGVITTCEYLPQYGCLRLAPCRWVDGSCRFVIEEGSAADTCLDRLGPGQVPFP